MSVAYYHSYVLPWTVVPEETKRLKKIVQLVLLCFVVLGLVIPVLPVPEVDRTKQTEIPPRLAKLILERKKPKPKPIIEAPKKEEKKKEEKKEKKKEEKKKEKPKKKEVKKKKPEKPKVDPEKQRAKAREKASRSGLLSMMDDLADLRDEPVLPKNIKLSKATTSSKAKQTKAPELLTSNVQGSGGLSSAALKRATTQSRTLGSRSGTEVDSPVDASAAEAFANASSAARSSPRPEDEIQRVFDKYKGAIHRRYNRALRKDPTLRGVIVLDITIAPNGKVLDVKISSSDLKGAPKFEKKILALVKTFKFKAKDVDKVTIRYPLDFSPIS